MSSHKYPMETYHGMVRSPTDAIKLFEACRLGLLPRVQRRLSEKERQAIRSGSVFVWDEMEAGMRRWTDGKSWSASRVSGSFLTYREMEGKRGGGGFNSVRRVSGKTPDSSGRGSDEDQDDGEPDGYRYKADGLMKQSFSITTSNGQHLHLISYYARPGPGESDLIQPVNDRSLRSVIPVKGMYPESSMADSAPILPTRNGMPQQLHHPSQYSHHHAPPPLQTGPHPCYPPYSQPGYSWPPSPIATPPYNHHYTTASAPYPPQHSQPAPPPGHYSRHSPPPPSLGYYSGPSPHGAPQTLPPYNNGPRGPSPPISLQYERLPLPPPQSTRASPPAHAGHSPRSSHSSYGPPSITNGRGPSHSPSSVYHQPPPVLPPVTGPGSYQNTSPRSRNNMPPASQGGPLPALNAAAAQSAAAVTPPTLAQPTTRSSALTPPYQQKPYYPGDTYANGSSPTSTGRKRKSSLSTLLHPDAVVSESGSANTGSSKSASSSPRHLGTSLVAAAAAAASSKGALGPLPQQYLQPAPSGEDSRALSRLDRKFCI